MPRTRSIRPGFFSNEQLGEMPPLVRLLFAGLWTIADREGRLLDRPKKLKAELLPYDNVNIDKALNTLAGGGFIERYEAAGERCIQVQNWRKHQHPHPREDASEIPPPNGQHADPEPDLDAPPATAEPRPEPDLDVDPEPDLGMTPARLVASPSFPSRSAAAAAGDSRAHARGGFQSIGSFLDVALRQQRQIENLPDEVRERLDRPPIAPNQELGDAHG